MVRRLEAKRVKSLLNPIRAIVTPSALKGIYLSAAAFITTLARFATPLAWVVTLVIAFASVYVNATNALTT